MKKYVIKMIVVMPRWDDKILKYNHGEKSLKVPFVIYFWFRMFATKNDENEKDENENDEKFKKVPKS